MLPESLSESNRNRCPNGVGISTDLIRSVPIIASPAFRPEIYPAIQTVLEDIGEQLVFMIVIGDAGDEQYRGIPFADLDLILDKTENELKLIVIHGIRLNSQSMNNRSELIDIYNQAYNEFGQNFHLIADIQQTTMQDSLATEIGEAIVNQINYDMSEREFN